MPAQTVYSAWRRHGDGLGAAGVNTGKVDVNVIVAAVVIWRLFYGLLALVPGTFTLMKFSNTHPDLLKNALNEFRGPEDGEADADTESDES